MIYQPDRPDQLRAAKQGVQQPMTPTPSYKYVINSEAARAAGRLSRAVARYAKSENVDDSKEVISLLNETPFSSINTAHGLTLTTHDDGHKSIGFIGEKGESLGTFDVDRLIKQASNLNNYAHRVKATYRPAREAVFGSKELFEGAKAAGDSAYESALAGTMEEGGVYTRQNQGGGLTVVDPDNARQRAMDKFIAQYGPQEAGYSQALDTSFYQTQSPIMYRNDAGQQQALGLATGVRTGQTAQQPAGGFDPRALASQLAGGQRGQGGQPSPNDPPPPAPQAAPAPMPTPQYIQQQPTYSATANGVTGFTRQPSGFAAGVSSYGVPDYVVNQLRQYQQQLGRPLGATDLERARMVLGLTPVQMDALVQRLEY